MSLADGVDDAEQIWIINRSCPELSLASICLGLLDSVLGSEYRILAIEY